MGLNSTRRRIPERERGRRRAAANGGLKRGDAAEERRDNSVANLVIFLNIFLAAEMLKLGFRVLKKG